MRKYLYDISHIVDVACLRMRPLSIQTDLSKRRYVRTARTGRELNGVVVVAVAVKRGRLPFHAF